MAVRLVQIVSEIALFLVLLEPDRLVKIMSDYKNTSSPYHSKRQIGGKGSANNLGLRKYEATTEYSFDSTPDEDEEFNRYGYNAFSRHFADHLEFHSSLITDFFLIVEILKLHFFSYETQWLQYLNDWDKIEDKVRQRMFLFLKPISLNPIQALTGQFILQAGKLVRMGIPPKLRGSVWYAFIIFTC